MMTKRFVFLLVLLLVLMASTVTVLAADSDPAKKVETEIKAPADITSPGGVAYFTENNSDLFFNQDINSEASYLLTVAAVRDLKANDPLRFVLTGSVQQLESEGDEILPEIDDTLIVLLYIKRDGKFAPLDTVDAKVNKDTNLVETPKLLYAKIKLDNLGTDKVNELRIIAFHRSQMNKLDLKKNLQITDIKVVARTYTVMDRMRIGIAEVMRNTFIQFLK
jgi:hypothetical protein